MGAPFWSTDEKDYFVQQIVPRSHYASGQYESTGRSFDDLAVIMQRDLDARNMSRRIYNGDLLFQHWYQRVRPEVVPGSTPAATATPAAPVAAPEDNAQDDDTEGPASPKPSVTDSEATDIDPSLARPEEDDDDSASIAAASNAVDLEAGEIIEADTSSGGNSANNADADAGSGTELPIPRSVSPAASLPVAAGRGSSSTKRSHTGRGSAAPSKKVNRGRKKSSRIGHHTDSDEDVFPKNPGKARSSAAGSTAGNVRAHSGPLPSGLDRENDPHRLSHPVPIPGQDPFMGLNRNAPGNSPVRGLFSPNAGGGPNPFRTPGAAPGTHRIIGATQTVAQNHEDVARLHRVATGSQGGPQQTNGPQQTHGQTQQPRGPQPQGQSQPQGGSASASTSASAPGPSQVRVHPVTGQRLGQVTLQGPTYMTYCPSCQRHF